MNIDESPRVVTNKSLSKNAHEAGQNDALGCESIDDRHQRRIKRLATCKGAMINHRRCESALARVCKARRVSAIAHDRADRKILFNECAHVAAAPRYQCNDARHYRVPSG